MTILGISLFLETLVNLILETPVQHMYSLYLSPYDRAISTGAV